MSLVPNMALEERFELAHSIDITSRCQRSDLMVCRSELMESVQEYGLEINKIYNEDCMVGMQKIKDNTIDMVLCVLPYGTTQNSWDSCKTASEMIVFCSFSTV